MINKAILENYGDKSALNYKIHFKQCFKIERGYLRMELPAQIFLIWDYHPVMPHHLWTMHQAILRHTKTEPPSLNIIKEVLGNFFSISDGTDSASPV